MIDDGDRARRSASLENERNNEALAASTRYAPRQWTAAEESQLVQNLYGTEQERLDRIQREHDERARRS